MGLSFEAFEETGDDAAFVAGRDKNSNVLGISTRYELEFLATHEKTGRKEPNYSEENEDETDKYCHVMPFCAGV